MPTAYLSPSQLKELTDVSVNPGSAQNNYPLTWNNTTSKWEASNNIAGVTIRKGVGVNTQAIGSVCNSYGNNWIAQGLGASEFATTASQFISQGNAAAGSNASGVNFLAQGELAAASNNGGGYFLAQGFAAGYLSTTGAFWQAQGAAAGQSNTTGAFWVAQGFRAGYSNTSGGNWTAQGTGAGESNTSGGNWMAQGRSAGYSNTTGSSWVAQGLEAGYFETRSNVWNVGNTRDKSLICGNFANNCIYFGHPGGAPAGVYSSSTAGYGDAIASDANVPVPTAAVHAAASNTTRASLRIDSGVAPTTQNTGDIWVNSSNNSLNFQLPLINLQGTQVLATRRTGWSAPTGTATRTTFATFAGQDISATPTEAEVQAIDDHVKVLSERLKALIDDLTTHGLIGT